MVYYGDKHMEYIEDTIRTDEELNSVKQKIVNNIGNKQIKQIKLNNVRPYKVALEFNGDDYNLKVIMTVFKDDINAKIYDMFTELEQYCFSNQSTSSSNTML